MCMGIIVYYNENPEYYSNSQLASQCAMSTRADLNDWAKKGEKGIESGTGSGNANQMGIVYPVETENHNRLFRRLNSNFNCRLNLLKHL